MHSGCEGIIGLVCAAVSSICTDLKESKPLIFTMFQKSLPHQLPVGETAEKICLQVADKLGYNEGPAAE